MKRYIITACLIGLPFAGFADITINAYAQDGAIAYLYDSLGATFGTTTFSGGQAIIDTSGVVNGTEYGMSMSYMPGNNWYSNIAWDDGGGGAQYKKIYASTAYTVQDAITGAITSRSLGGTTASVTYSANGPVGIYDNPTNELDAQLGLYRSAATEDEVINGSIINRTWTGAGLGAGYGWDVSSAGFLGMSLITLTNNTGSFSAQYLADDLGGGEYELSLLSLDKGFAFDDGSIVSNGNDVVFTVNGLGSGSYDDGVPYYVLMDKTWIYDDDGNYSEAYDTGLSLTSPDHYVIPEPAVITLLLAAGGGMLVIRRFAMM